MIRTASRVDGNQPYIVAALRRIGCSVLHLHQLKNCFDLLVGYRGRTFLMEVKDPSQPPSKRKLTPGEEEFRRTWNGTPYHIVETIDQAIALVTAPAPCLCPKPLPAAASQPPTAATSNSTTPPVPPLP
ncbi:hypothetical protein [uncultured Hymenobacter sp.]|uniref:hypothetical protein n=1 Tax=uncultured Hymenobacter sp. TaxID=170016 RepID=UPI0035CAFC0C